MDNLSIGGPTEIGRSTHLRSPGKYPPVPGRDRIVVKQLTRNKKQQDFAYGPETTVVAVTRTAVLTEHSSIWIHASRAKLVEKGPGPDPRETGKEVLTGAESPDLEQDNQGKGVY
ncbi:unnamed protein product [Staurois parvus]|uniref:Uncharacterized protein n=1 Tax=Staurois parvus TaxID=386267 RepID=A0ABN9HPK0_9NEOB|nr:unnamed protein product [Staurois parvus]